MVYFDFRKSQVYLFSLTIVLFVLVSLFTNTEIAYAAKDIENTPTSHSQGAENVQATTIRVVNGSGTPQKNARVLRLAGGQRSGGKDLQDVQGNTLMTNSQGEIVATINSGDKLFAMAPISYTDSYTIYITNGDPISSGLKTHIVTDPNAVQVLTVTKNHPLYLVNLSVSVEWDSTARQDILEQLKASLRQTSHYLYDFTNGQMAFGELTISQNADDWAYADILVHSSNRLRPYAEQGGIVTRATSETIQSVQSLQEKIEYRPGQINLGSSWDRYGNPEQGFSDDWSLALAHELGHYLLFLDETYLGFDGALLHTRDKCNKSAMGDLYGSKAATEFVADSLEWLTNCADTLSNQTLKRTEWQTIQKWYPDVQIPTEILTGPSVIAYDWTAFIVRNPILPNIDAIPDLNFYFDYAETTKSSSEARTYLLKWKEDNGGGASNSGDHIYAIDLGTPFGDQNRIVALGAELKDKICIFDRPKQSYGCETVEDGDARIQVVQNANWNPIIQFTPINSRTYELDITLQKKDSSALMLTNRLRAKIFPEYGAASSVVTLTLQNVDQGIYHGQIRLTTFSPSGIVQIWVDEQSTESIPRREMLVSFSVAGNLGEWTSDVDKRRADGGIWRGGGAPWRANRTQWRPKYAPITSSDGQMTFYTRNPLDFPLGQFFTIQGMGSLEKPSPGRTVIGQAYFFTGTPGLGPLFAVTGSISIQYLFEELRNANANENLLRIYFYNGVWERLPTDVDSRYNIASAPSRGFGIYALMASFETAFQKTGWNQFTYLTPISAPTKIALESISGSYQTVYDYVVDDSEDPWKVFDVDAPNYANDLAYLIYPRIYLITTTKSVTLSLVTQPLQRGGLTIHEPVLPSPPSMQYGSVSPRSVFIPAGGMTVIATINGRTCGQAKTKSFDKTVVYAIDVEADDAGKYAGCGAPGRDVTIFINGTAMEPKNTWNNGKALRNNLLPSISSSTSTGIFLPVVTR